MAEQNAALTAQNTKLAEQMASILIRLDEDAQARALHGGGGDAPIDHGAGAGAGLRPVAAPLTPEAIRAIKISQLYQFVRKSHKVKDFKPSTSTEDIREWLTKFDLEITRSAKVVCDLDLNTAPLTRVEYVNLLQDKLDFTVIKELDNKFGTHAPPITWETVTIAELK